MKTLKRWLALLLAVTLLGSNAVYSLSSSLKANELNAEEVARTEQTNPTPAPEPEINVEGATLTEVQPEQSITEVPAVQPAAPEAAEETPIEETVYHMVDFLSVNPLTGKVIKIVNHPQRIEQGKAAQIPEIEDFEGYEFVEWRTEPNLAQGEKIEQSALQNIQGDVNAYALYKQVEGSYTVKINYLYKGTETSAHAPFEAEVPNGTTYTKEVTSPTVAGCTPDQSVVTVDTSVAYEMNVYYEGKEVEYTVRHVQEPVDETQPPIIKEEENVIGIIGQKTNAQPKTYKGFAGGKVTNVTIPGESGVVIDVFYTRNSYEIYFDTDGGSYVAPKTYKYEEKVETPKPDPTKLGQTFAGWNNIPNGGMPAEDVTATATWTASGKAQYRLIYWLEKETIDGVHQGYDYGYSQVRTGRVNDFVDYDPYIIDWSKNPQGEVDSRYNMVAFPGGAPARITADGQLVQNIYFQRNTFNITFSLKQSDNSNTPLTETITAKFGENITEQWNAINQKYPGQLWEETGKRQWFTLMANMPARNISLTGESHQNDKKIVYYTEGLDGAQHVFKVVDVGDIPGSEIVRLSEQDKAPINGFSFQSWLLDLGAFTGTGAEDLGQPYTGAWLNYTRNTYDVVYENTAMKVEKVKYEAAMDSAKPTIEETDIPRPQTIDSDYVFAGWYTTPAYTEKVDWTQKMPSHNVQVFAKWEKPKYTISFNANGANQSVADITVFKYETIQNKIPKELTKEDATFLGWFTDETCRRPFVEATQITKNMTLYAGWSKTSGTYNYTIRGVDEEGEPIAGFTISTATGNVNGTYDVIAPSMAGYSPLVTNKVITLTEDEMKITFVYRAIGTWTCTVNYVDQAGAIVGLPETKSVNKSKDQLVVTYKAISGHRITGATQQVATQAKPEITFVYEPINLANCKVKHLLEDVNGNYVLKEESTWARHPVGDTYTARPKAYDHFELITSDSDRKIVLRNGDNEVELKYARKNYNVSFDSVGGTEVPSQKIKYEGTATEPEAPTKDGFEFQGWYTETGKEYEFATPVDSDVTLTAKWVAKNAVTYEYTGELPGDVTQAPAAEEYVAGSEVQISTDYTDISTITDPKGTWTFSGWTADGITTTGGAFIMPNEEVTFTGSWTLTTPATYTVIYKINGIQDGLAEQKEYNSLVTLRQEPTKEGYSFSGWTPNVNFNMPARDVEVTGDFTANDNTLYQVEHYQQNIVGNDYTLTDTESKTGITDTEVTGTPKTYEGFSYDGTVDGTVVTGEIAGDGSLILKLYYTRKSYQVTYLVDNQKDDESETYRYEATVTLRDKPTKEGYTFHGWSRTENFQMPAKEVEITGNYVANGDTEYTVEHYQEGIDGTYAAVATETLTGKTDAQAAATAKEYTGFTYDGTVSGSKPAGTIAGNGKLVLKLYYTRNSYTVTYEIDGNTHGTVDNYKYGEATNALRPEPTKEGYTFGGWKGTLPEKMGTENVVITGSYTINSYKVTYQVDGKAYGIPEQKEYNSLVTLRQEPTKEGYSFSGWTPNANFNMPARDVEVTGDFTANANTTYQVQHYQQNVVGNDYTLKETESKTGITDTEVTETPKTYEGFSYDAKVDGTVVTGKIAGDGSLILKLYYTRKSYQVTYLVDNQKDGESETYRYEATVTLRDKPTKEGYTFHGWSRTENFQMPAEAVEITGNYVANGDTEYTVEHYQEGIDGTYAAVATETLTGKTDAQAAATAKEYTGFTYDRMVSGSKPAGTITGNGKLVLKLYYTRNSYTVTYEIDGQQYGYPDNYKYGEATNALRPEPTKEGYTFGGWTGTLPEKMGTENVVITGSYTINSYKVTYQVDGEAYGIPEQKEYNSLVTLRQEPTKEGYSFSGWTPNVNFNMPADDVIIEGTFVINNYEYTVNYYYDNVLADGETITEQAKFKSLVQAEAPTTRERNDNNYMLVKGIHEITIGTETEANVIHVYYVLDNNGPDGTPDEIPDSQEYGIAYDSNAENAQGETVDTNIYPVGYQVPLKTNAFTLAGYNFAEWASSRQGGNAIGNTIAMMQDGVVVYAQWLSEEGETPAPPTTPVTPATPTPTAPAAITPPVTTPAVTPAVVAAAATVAGPVATLAANVIDQIADVQEILQAEDGAVPLANNKLDQAKDCILHFLIMLVALCIEIGYIRSVKKRQKKIFELREELALTDVVKDSKNVA